jgi:hypothetical protein
MKNQLTGSHRSTYEAVFQHPVARNLVWRDVCSMLGALPDVVQQEHNGTLKVTRSGKTLVLHGPAHKNVANVQELMDLRRFLEQTDGPSQPPAQKGAHLLVVINHREARVYQAELHGTVPQRIAPFDPGGDSGRHLHYVQDDSNGQRKPERKSFYEAVAKTLQGAEQVLVFGSGTGASSAMEQLLLELKRHHPNVAKHIIGSVVVNEQHLSEDQLLAKAREFYATEGTKAV